MVSQGADDADDFAVGVVGGVVGLVRAYTLAIEPSQPLHLTRPPLLEREAELSVVRALVDATPTGGGRFVVIEGPAGIGKTRLVEEALAIAAARGLRTMMARAGELERRVRARHTRRRARN